MTLILSCLTQDYVIQVSDRRLTLSNGELFDDDTNKMVFFCDRLSLAYSGLARIGNENTDVWLTKALSDPDCRSLSDAVQTIQTKATETFATIRISRKWKRHSFVGVGWTRAQLNEPFRPIVCLISNAHDDQGSLVQDARDEFTAFINILQGNESFVLLSVGEPLHKTDQVTLERYLKTCIAKGVSPNSFIRLLATTVRKISTTSQTVGQNLLAVSIPKKAMETDGGSPKLLVTPLHPNSPSFLYIPAEERQGKFYGPNIVCGGSGALTNIGGGTIKDGKSTFRSNS